MSKFLHQLFCSVNVTLLSSLLIFPVRAQISPDGTTSTTVSVDGHDFTIQEGDRAGDNLFHSFTEFSVPIGGKAFFHNSADIVNIFSRVTGGNISNIDGLLGANGNANLFLINPAGIIFGEHASLDIGGSFLGSTADSIVFPDGEFSATNLSNPPLITINAPIGLQFRETAAEIINRSRFEVENELPGRIEDTNVVGLGVKPGKTLALIGGNLVFEGGNLTANGGRIELGSVGSNNLVNFTLTDGSLVFDYAEVQAFQDISLFPRTIVDTSGDTGGGAIQVQGRQITLTGDDMFSPVLIFSNTISTGQGQIITINASESIDISGNSAAIVTQTDEMGIAGNIVINTKELTMNGGGFISSFASLNDIDGRAGDITINASESVKLIGSPTAIFADAEKGAGGNLFIETPQLSVRDGAQISTSTFGEGQAGNIEIIADSILLSGFPESGANDGNRSGIFVSTQPGGMGDAGLLDIIADTLTIENGARISASTRGPGQGNETNLTLDNLVIRTGGEIGAGSLIDTGVAGSDRGDGGTLIIIANNSIEVSGTNNINGGVVNSRIFTLTETIGDAGNLIIETNQLTVSDGGEINASSAGIGNAGNLTIETNQLTVSNGGEINASSLVEDNSEENLADTERGNGGTLTITADDSIEIIGTNNINGETFNSRIFTLSQGTGDAGNLTIETNQLTLSNGGEINVSSTGTGAAGTLEINAENIDLNQGFLIATTITGAGGNIELIVSENLTLKDNSLISAASTNADGGNIDIDAAFIVGFPSTGLGNDIRANAEGQGGNISIDAKEVLGFEVSRGTVDRLNNTNDIDASSRATGSDGNVTINSPDANPIQGVNRLATNPVSTDAIASDSCSARQGTASLIIKGKGGIVPEPTRFLTAEVLIPDGKPIKLEKQTDTTSLLWEKIEQDQENINYIPASFKPIQTDNGDLYPARGIVKTADGKIILTAYPNPDTTTRNLEKSLGCS